MRGWWLALVGLVGCGDAPGGPPTKPSMVVTGVGRYLATLDEGAARARLCGSLNDRVSRYFCASPAPAPKSLGELERGLGLDPATVSFTLTANSTAAGARAVNPINPRAILFDGVPHPHLATRQFLALGFTRGEQVVELATRDEVTLELRFFLVEFRQACNETAAGCSLAQLLTPALEEGWTSLRVFDDLALANTAVDCLRCHQPQGPGTRRLLRMQEFSAPWLHFLAPATEDPAGGQLVADFRTAHPATEPYAGLPGARLDTQSDPGILSSLVAQESGAQPNEFKSFPIALELQFGATSPTWEAIAARARAGDAIPVPYWGLRVSDPSRQLAAAQRYRAVLAGTTTEPLLDLRALQTEEAERAMSMRPALGASGVDVLLQACQQCHHPRFDQALSRARFDPRRLAELDQLERTAAIQRLHLADDDPLKMPPVLSGTLTADEVERATAALE